MTSGEGLGGKLTSTGVSCSLQGLWVGKSFSSGQRKQCCWHKWRVHFHLPVPIAKHLWADVSFNLILGNNNFSLKFLYIYTTTKKCSTNACSFAAETWWSLELRRQIWVETAKLSGTGSPREPQPPSPQLAPPVTKVVQNFPFYYYYYLNFFLTLAAFFFQFKTKCSSLGVCLKLSRDPWGWLFSGRRQKQQSSQGPFCTFTEIPETCGLGTGISAWFSRSGFCAICLHAGTYSTESLFSWACKFSKDASASEHTSATSQILYMLTWVLINHTLFVLELWRENLTKLVMAAPRQENDFCLLSELLFLFPLNITEEWNVWWKCRKWKKKKWRECKRVNKIKNSGEVRTEWGYNWLGIGKGALALAAQEQQGCELVC